MEFNKSKTFENLARSFSGESQAGLRYQILAEKASNEGYENIKQLIKGLAKNEVAHAKAFYEALTCNCKCDLPNIEVSAGFPYPCGDLKALFKAAIHNESEEHLKIYPSFAKIAKDEGFDKISTLFTLISMVENCHSMMLSEILTKLENSKLYKDSKDVKWKCLNCGHEHTSKSAWTTCPLCAKPQGYVKLNLGDN